VRATDVAHADRVLIGTARPPPCCRPSCSVRSPISLTMRLTSHDHSRVVIQPSLTHTLCCGVRSWDNDVAWVLAGLPATAPRWFSQWSPGPPSGHQVLPAVIPQWSSTLHCIALATQHSIDIVNWSRLQIPASLWRGAFDLLVLTPHARLLSSIDPDNLFAASTRPPRCGPAARHAVRPRACPEVLLRRWR
jgi:hypothetical protein